MSDRPSEQRFNRDNAISLAVFFGSLILTFLINIVYDVYVYIRKGTARTISWSIVLATRDCPFFMIIFVAIFFSVVGGLLTHFWFWQPIPSR